MTPTQLKQRVLEKLTVLAAGENPNIEDATLVGDRYASLHDMLITDALVNWTLTEDVPAWAESAIVMMVAAASADEFGVPEPAKSEIKREGVYGLPSNLGGPSLAEKQLRSQSARNFVYYPQASEYF